MTGQKGCRRKDKALCYHTLKKAFPPCFLNKVFCISVCNWALQITQQALLPIGDTVRLAVCPAKSSRICFNLHFKVEVREEITCWEVIGKQEAAASHLCF